MKDINKTDPVLGRRVHERLVKLGIETPLAPSVLSNEDKIKVIRNNMETIMTTMGLDLTDDSLQDTPNRWAKMMVNELNWGLDIEMFPKCTAIDNKMNTDHMVCETGVTVMSQCEHHLVTIDGTATIAYIPKDKVLGLSKMNRIVEYFARRPQVQERLTAQVAEALKFITGTDDVAVVMDCEHYCVKSRGVEDHGSSTTTSYLSGAFKNEPACRAEFMALANRG